MLSIAAPQLQDLIIVGAGAAGCVLASRLSEVPGKRILLIEAGPDAPPGAEHRDIRDAYPVSSSNPRFFWPGLCAEAGAELHDGSSRTNAPYLQGYGVGGGSNVNGMAADRGHPDDYDEWRDLGAAGWGWNDVLPYFKKLESDWDCASPMHGRDGPLPIRRVPPEHWAPFARAFARSCLRFGVGWLDYCEQAADGVSAMAMNGLADRRVSASMAYLTPQVRQRPHLRILPQTKATRLIVREGRVLGVEAQTAAGLKNFLADEVVLACGAIHSPALLLRSGIGPAGHLRSLGIHILRDLPGVGSNLQNHPLVMLAAHLRGPARQSARQRTWQHNQLRYSSNVQGCAPHDVLIFPVNKAGWHALGRATATVAVMVGKAYSKGSVELISVDHTVAPAVRFNALDDPRDLERLVDGVRRALEILGDAEMLGVRNEVFIPNSRFAARLGQRSAWTALQAAAIEFLLRASPLRRIALRGCTLDVHAMVNDENALRRFVRQHAQVVYHPCGTCRMGREGDTEAVVDAEGRVLGIESLRVADASVFPNVPRGGTHIPVLMAAEKMADHVKAHWRAGKMPVHFARAP